MRAAIPGVLAALGLASAAVAVAEVPSQLAPAEQDWLIAHNEARDAFGVASLRWSDELADEARQWAQHLAREEALRHSSTEERSRTGENLWMGSAGHYLPGQMIAHFVEEKRHFRPGEFPRVSATGNWTDVGHYTQIVWAETREVGCAAARGARFDVLVCRYWPSGNVIGQRIEPHRQIARR